MFPKIIKIEEFVIKWNIYKKKKKKILKIPSDAGETLIPNPNLLAGTIIPKTTPLNPAGPPPSHCRHNNNEQANSSKKKNRSNGVEVRLDTADSAAAGPSSGVPAF